MPQGNLHKYAVDAEANLEKLATGLAQAQADPGAVEAITKMAGVVRKLVVALGKGQEETGDKEPPAQPGPEQPPQPVPAGPPDAGPRETLDSATTGLHQARVAAADERRKRRIPV